MPHLLVRYEPPDEGPGGEWTLAEEEPLLFGRAPDEDGVCLHEADQDVSHNACQIILWPDGVRITNRNRNLLITIGPEDLAGSDLIPGESRTVQGSGWIHIRGPGDPHRITFRIVGELSEPAYSPGDGPVTLVGADREAWESLGDPYKEVCAGIFAAWIYDDLENIPSRTVPDNNNLGRLLDVGETAARRKLDHTFDNLRDSTGNPFAGHQRKNELAEWLKTFDFVSREDVDRLPGLRRFRDELRRD